MAHIWSVFGWGCCWVWGDRFVDVQGEEKPVRCEIQSFCYGIFTFPVSMLPEILLLQLWRFFPFLTTPLPALGVEDLHLGRVSSLYFSRLDLWCELVSWKSSTECSKSRCIIQSRRVFTWRLLLYRFQLCCRRFRRIHSGFLRSDRYGVVPPYNILHKRPSMFSIKYLQPTQPRIP